MQFRGWNSKVISNPNLNLKTILPVKKYGIFLLLQSVPLLKEMIKRLPERHELLNLLGTQFLFMGQNDAAGYFLFKQEQTKFDDLRRGFSKDWLRLKGLSIFKVC